MTKEEVIAAMKECTATLGHAPSVHELEKTIGVMKADITRTFGTYGRALKASGLERQGSGYALELRELFVQWAEVVRALRKIPTICEFEEHTKRYSRPLARRCGIWGNVPQRMLEYIRMEGVENEWRDVLEVISRHLEPARRIVRLSKLPSGVLSGLPSAIPSSMSSGGISHGIPFSLPSSMASRPKVMLGRPMYGAPLLSSPLSCAPINELGVVFLFGAVALQMGFVVTRLQPEFPDGEALRQVEPDRWQKVLMEFEHESRNFLLHGHRVEDCDLIVCWRHNWAECPLEVLELSKVFSNCQN